MPIEVLNPITQPGWDALIEGHPEAGFFQSAAWARVLADSYGYTPRYFVRRPGGRLTGLIPLMGIASVLTGRRGSALPFTDVCDPLARDSAEFAQMFGAVIAHAARAGWDTIDLRGGRGFLDGQPAAAQFLVHTLPLGPDEAEVARAFRPTTRRNVRRSERGPLGIERHTSRAAVADYYRLHCGTRRQHGLPPQPWRFFDNVQRHVLARGRGFVVLASAAGRPVAGAVFFHFGDTLIYKFGASDRRFHGLRPNQRVMWEAIRWGCRNGMRRLDLGRSDPGDPGLLQYKTGWGARGERVAYYRYDVRRRSFRAAAAPVRSSFRFFRLLPAGLLRVTGRLLYRHMA